MSKLKVTRLAVDPSRIGPSDLEIALSKARAARILLAADVDYLQIPVSLNPRESEEEIHAWIHGFAFEALDAALKEADAARQRVHGPPRWGKRKAVA